MKFYIIKFIKNIFIIINLFFISFIFKLKNYIFYLILKISILIFLIMKIIFFIDYFKKNFYYLIISKLNIN